MMDVEVGTEAYKIKIWLNWHFLADLLPRKMKFGREEHTIGVVLHAKFSLRELKPQY